MNDEEYNKKFNKKLYEKKYIFNQFNNWVVNNDKIEEESNPIIYHKKKYNSTCYGNWLGVKNYDEKSVYYNPDSRIYGNKEIEKKINYGSDKIKLYTVSIVYLFNRLTCYYNKFLLNLIHSQVIKKI